MSIADADYLKTLEERKKESHVYRKFQLLGLEIAQILKDESHKALYIKLAKQYDGVRLLELAKNVAERKNVENKGAYFMKLFQEEKKTYGRNSNNTK